MIYEGCVHRQFPKHSIRSQIESSSERRFGPVRDLLIWGHWTMPISLQILEESIHRDGRGKRTLYLQDRIHYISQTGQLEGTCFGTTKAMISRVPLLVHIPRGCSQHRWESNDSVSANVDSNHPDEEDGEHPNPSTTDTALGKSGFTASTPESNQTYARYKYPVLTVVRLDPTLPTLPSVDNPKEPRDEDEEE